MTIGVVDMSNAYSRKLALEQGAQRAVEKIMQTTQDDTVENTLKTEVVCQVNGTNANGTCKTSPITAANVTVTWRLECRSGGTITAQTATECDDFRHFVCSGGGHRGAVHPGNGQRQIYADVSDPLPRFERLGRHLPYLGHGRHEDTMKLRRRIARNQDGVAAIEMAFALPILIVMIWMFVQLAEVYRALPVSSRVLVKAPALRRCALNPKFDERL